MALKKSRKRNHDESSEFMPLSKGKYFESDDENNCEYDWGFKKTNKSIVNDEKPFIKTEGKEDITENINRRFAYKSIDTHKLKDEDKKILLENLTKIYNRSYVYVPSFYDVCDIVSNTDKLLDSSIKQMFNKDINELNDKLNSFWLPLKTSYVDNNRLSENCSAYKMIVRHVDQCIKTRQIYEDCLENLKDNGRKLAEILRKSNNKDVNALVEIFRDVVGNVLMKYRDEMNVSFDNMAKESNVIAFLNMINDPMEAMKQRVEKRIKIKKEMKSIENDNKDEIDVNNNDDEEENNKSDGIVIMRPASKTILDNRGLIPRRKKIDSNPRVKHRMKFKKGMKRYHSQVARSRDDIVDYQGEQSGIRTGLIKSRKFK